MHGMEMKMKDLVEIIKANPGAVAVIDNDSWTLWKQHPDNDLMMTTNWTIGKPKTSWPATTILNLSAMAVTAAETAMAVTCCKHWR